MISPSKADIKLWYQYCTHYLRLRTSDQGRKSTIGITSARPFIWAFKHPICTVFKVTSLHLSTLAEFWSLLTIPPDIIGYRHSIIKRIPRLDSPHRGHSLEPLNVLFAPFWRPLIHTFKFKLGRNFGPLIIWHDYLGYRQAINRRIPALNFPHQEHSLEPLNVLFAPFSRPLIHTFKFKLGRNFGPLIIWHDYLGYRQAINRRIPALNFPHQEHSLEPLNVLFAPFSRPLIHTFTLGQNFGPLIIWHDYLGYRHAINKRKPGLDSPQRERSLELPNSRLRTCFRSLRSIFLRVYIVA